MTQNNPPPQITIDDVVNEGNIIWEKYKQVIREYHADKGITTQTTNLFETCPEYREKYVKFIHKIKTEHEAFSRAYMIVIMCMGQLHVYDSKIFYKYINYIQKYPWTSSDDYVKSQAKYMTDCYAFLNPKLTKDQLVQYKKGVFIELQKTQETILKTYNKIKELHDKKENVRHQDIVSELKTFLASKPADFDPEKIVSEIDTNNN